MIPIIGVVKDDGVIDYSAPPGALGEVPVPADDGEWRALRVLGKAMHPTFRDGNVLYYLSTRFRPDQVANRECVVSAEGQIYVRFLYPSSDPSKWHLTSPNAEPMMNRSVDWASPIAWVRKWEVNLA